MKFSPPLPTFLLLFTLLIFSNTAAAQAQSNNPRIQHVINRWVARVEDRIERMMDRYCDLFTDYQEKYGSDLPTFCGSNDSVPSPTPEPTPEATPEPTPSPDASPASSPATSPSLEPSPEPSSEPSPTTTPIAGLVISEVFYDVDDAHGAEGTNEWVELYNNSDSTIDLSGFMLEDASSSDLLPDGTTIPANGFLVITNNTSTTTFWSIPSDTIALGASIGNGLGNGGDFLSLKDASGTTLDAVSWGTNITAFDPSVGIVPPGSSMARHNASTDTNTASDWTELTAPTPGQ